MPKLFRVAVILIALAAAGGGWGAEAEKKLPPARAETDRSVADIAAAIRPSLVKVSHLGREGMDGLGSGFVVSADGLIATNRHVIGEARRIQVELSDGSKHPVTEIHASDAHLDLALIKINATGLKPLPLGDSDAVQQGDPVVAMGNPLGLDFSVVEGVVSAVRELEEQSMIQVAMPIERGNSGGPLLDRRGRVLGLLTFKSQKAENLGFAMPVNQLKRLIAAPNPVPMNRWLTIGVLDPKTWRPLMGGEWTQHAGVVKSDSLGEGFGGRTLCLWIADEPPPVFEAAVSVRLEDEAGAAGLVFCADGGDQHYGFYPSAGKLRLTRFEGAFVNAWTVLVELPSAAYQPGEWNELRVRVDEARILCFVNGQKVIEQADAGLRGGHAGLCKFRQPAAEFKNFRIGADLAEPPLAPALADSLRSSLQGFLGDPNRKAATLEQMLAVPGAGRQLIIEQAAALEKNAAALRNLEADLHRAAVARELQQELATADGGRADLLQCALLLSRHDNPDLDLALYQRAFQRMVDELAADPAIKQGGAAAVQRLRKYLFDENGFHGSRHDYDNKSNSYINEVLDDREGLPITLSILFLELAARLGIEQVVSVPAPGHFMVGWRAKPGDELRLIDVFDRGKELTLAELPAAFGLDQPVPAELLQPASAREIVVRMIRNLLASADSDQQALPYLSLILALQPEAHSERFTRAQMRDRGGDRAGARDDIGFLLANPPADLPAEALGELERLHQSLEPVKAEK